MPKEPCVHWWIIETPNGPTSKGRCKLCGAEKVFRNHFEPNINQIMRGERQMVVDNKGGEYGQVRQSRNRAKRS